MGVWKLEENYGQSEHVMELTSKSWPHVQKNVGRRKKENFAREEFRAPAGHGPQFVNSGYSPTAPFFLQFFDLIFFWYYEEVWRWAWHLGRMGVQHFHLLNLAPILGKVKSSILHGAWRFHFFPNWFAKIRVHQDLHIHCWNFCLMKKWIH
jgi:hypothetical protein